MPVLACPGGVARLSFDEACGGTYGAADYIALAQAYHTLVLTGVPKMSLAKRDLARRRLTPHPLILHPWVSL